MARVLNPDPVLMGKRVSLLEEIRVRFGLEKLVDYGYNEQLYPSLDYGQLQVIEIDPEVTDPNVVNGDFLTEVPNHLSSNTCYTCFVFLNPPSLSIVDEEKFKSEFASIRALLMGAGLTNSFMVLWIRSGPGNQDFRVYNLETQSDVTSDFSSFA